ncbi:MAG: tyrosine-protein phosphatase [Phocaeicola sp.]
MKVLKLNKLILTLSLLLLTQIASSCREKRESLIESSLEGTVTGINVFGNLELSITSAELENGGFEYGDILYVEGDGIPTPFHCPYIDEVIYVGHFGICLMSFRGQSNIALSLTNASFYERIGGTVGGRVKLSMSKKHGYLDTYKLLSLKSSDDRSDYSSSAEFANFYMTSSGKIAERKLYRSSKPTMDKHGRGRFLYADTLARENEINLLISLSDHQSVWEEAIKDEKPVGPYSLEKYNDGKLLLNGMGVDIYQSDVLEKVKTAMDYMAVNEPPYLIFCDLGKDRTGMLCMLLEILAGATYGEVEENYMRSYANFYKINKESAAYPILKFITLDKILYVISKKGNVDIMELNKMESIKVEEFYSQLPQVVTDYFIKQVGITEVELATIMSKLEN